jgi:Kelch motif
VHCPTDEIFTIQFARLTSDIASLHSQLVGAWKSGVAHPFPVAEAQGAKIGKYNLIVGGFLAGFGSVSTQTNILDTTVPNAKWERQDDYPFPIGLTHGAFVTVGNKFYICGGYAGGGIGMHTDICMVFDITQPKGVGKQWQTFAPLPIGRAGGGMVYDSTLNALIFSAGAIRPTPQKRTAVDFSNTWMYSLSNPSAGWVAKTPMPFKANHMSSVTAIDATGRERHYFSSGQLAENEPNGNNVEHYEYDAVKDLWTKRKFMTLPRGHAASSTRPIGCGFIMVAGCTNGGQKVADISYYDTQSDTWTKIGDLPSNLNTPVCFISENTLYCDTGWDSGNFSKRIGITV